MKGDIDMKFFYRNKNTGAIHLGPKFFRISIFVDEKLIRIKISNKKYYLGNW